MTPLHIRRRVRNAFWRRGHLLPDTSFTRACQEAHIPDQMVGRFLAESPDTTEISAKDLAQKIRVQPGYVRLMVTIFQTPEG